MVKRCLDLVASELASLSKDDKLTALRAGEGRALACETIATAMPLLYDVSNAELAASQGADLCILNVFDVQAPAVLGLPPHRPEQTISLIKRLTGCMVAVNLEPVDPSAEVVGVVGFDGADRAGRLATVENAQRLADMGADMVVLTGNPGMGVTHGAMERAITAVAEAVGSRMMIAAGKMHAAGVLEEGGGAIADERSLTAFVDAGADIVLIPAPGTVPGCHEDLVRGWVSTIHRHGALAMTAIGTSQEGADVETIRRIALMAKMTGTDIHHLGDCGYFGVSLPENILAYSIAIRGRRHAYRRAALSPLR